MDRYTLMLIFSSVILAVVIGTLIMLIIKYHSTKKLLLDITKEHKRLKDENKYRSVDYSKNVLEYIKTFVSQIALIKFKEYISNNDTEKMTLASVEKLVKSVATTVKNAFVSTHIFVDDLLFTREFIDKYIIDVSMYMIRDMVDKFNQDQNNNL